MRSVLAICYKSASKCLLASSHDAKENAFSLVENQSLVACNVA